MVNILLFVLVAALAGAAWAVGSGGIGNAVLSAKSLGMGGIGTAAMVPDPITVYTNPAGLTGLPGTHLSLGSTWENLHGRYESPSGTPGSAMRSIDLIVPNIAFTHGWADQKLGLGLGLVSEYGTETHWPGDGPLRYLATNSRLHTVTFTGGVGYQIHPTLSIGAGPDFVSVPLVDLERNVNVNNLNAAVGSPTTTAPDAVSRFFGQDNGWGFHLGVHYRPAEAHSLGLAYHSKVHLRIQGSVSLTGLSGASTAAFGGSDYETSVYSDFVLPQNIQLGYAYRPTERLTLEVDAGWYEYHTSRDFNVRYPAATPAQINLLTNNGAGNPQPLDWRDAWNVATGVNYELTKTFEIRSGYYYIPWIAPEASFTPGLMDLTRHGLTLGIGIALTDTLALDAAYNAVFMKARTINNSIGVNQTGDPSVTASGRYTNFVNLVALNLTYRIP